MSAAFLVVLFARYVSGLVTEKYRSKLKHKFAVQY